MSEQETSVSTTYDVEVRSAPDREWVPIATGLGSLKAAEDHAARTRVEHKRIVRVQVERTVVA